MVIFGGFQQGNRTNMTSIYNFATNTWENVEIPHGQPIPCSRSGHSASIYNGNMYVFGGKNDSSEKSIKAWESQKLNDLWVFNIADKKWVEVEPEGEVPVERSGQTPDVYDDFMVVFGGIWDFEKQIFLTL